MADPHHGLAARADEVRRGRIAQDSVVGAGSIISGAIVRRSVISPDVRIDKDAEVSDAG